MYYLEVLEVLTCFQFLYIKENLQIRSQFLQQFYKALSFLRVTVRVREKDIVAKRIKVSNSELRVECD